MHTHGLSIWLSSVLVQGTFAADHGDSAVTIDTFNTFCELTKVRW